MIAAPCGCEQYEDAQTARPGEREALLAVCGDNASAWGCPRVQSSEISPVNLQVLRDVERITGCESGSLLTCPRQCASGDDVKRALRLYRASQGGGLSYDDDPPAAIVLASEAIGSSDAARVERESEERERDRQN